MNQGGSLRVGLIPVWLNVVPMGDVSKTPPLADVVWAFRDRQPVRVKCGLTAGEFIAEAVAWFLGRQMGVRLPDAGVVDWGGGVPAWGMSDAGARHWLSSDQNYLVNVEDVGAMLALDVLIFNCDRNSENIVIFDRTGGGAVATAIDHAWSKMIEPITIDAGLVGAELGIAAADEPVDQVPPESLPYEVVLPYMQLAVDRLNGVFERDVLELDAFVREACVCARVPHRYPQISAALHVRASMMQELIGRRRELLSQFFKALEAARGSVLEGVAS